MIENPFVIVCCDICHKTCGRQPNAILLLQEENRYVDYCMGCFLKIDFMIKKDYKYWIRSNLNYSLTDPKWSVMDDILLLKSIKK